MLTFSNDSAIGQYVITYKVVGPSGTPSSTQGTYTIQLLPAPTMTADMAGHTAGEGGGHTVLTGWTGGVGMVLAHLAAALLVGAWLAAGERAVWALVALAAGSMTTTWVRLRHVLLWRGPTGALPSRSRVNAWGTHATPLALDVLSSGVSRRGPPSTGLA